MCATHVHVYHTVSTWNCPMEWLGCGRTDLGSTSVIVCHLLMISIVWIMVAISMTHVNPVRIRMGRFSVYHFLKYMHHHYITYCCCPYIVNTVLLTCQENKTKVFVTFSHRQEKGRIPFPGFSPDPNPNCNHWLQATADD